VVFHLRSPDRAQRHLRLGSDR
jgi:transposase